MTEERNSLPPGVTAEDYLEMLEDRTAGSFYWNRDADEVYWSPKLLSLLGHDEQGVATLGAVEALIHPDDAGPHADVLARAVTEESSYDIDIRLRNADGAYQLFRVRGYWLKRDDRPARVLIGFLIELSEVARLRDQISRIERLFQAFFDNAPAAVYIKDQERRYLYGNAMTARIAGCSIEDLLSKGTADVFDAETDRMLAEVDRRVLEQGETVIRHGAFESATGGTHYVFDTTFPLVDPQTGEKLIGGFGLDTTRQHDAEQALAQAQKMDALGQLVGGIAHDFNNTLAVMQGNLDLIETTDDAAEIKESLDDIAHGVDRATQLTRQLLAYARKSVLSTELTSLNTVVEDLDRMLRRVLPESIAIEIRSGAELWNTRIDRGQVESAILNLVLNARDAMQDGGRITIKTCNAEIGVNTGGEPAPSLAPGRYVVLSVEDTGTGMSEAVLQRAFDPFYTTKGVGEGTGMGLPMVEGLMRQIGGGAHIRSSPGQGTTVCLHFPASFEAPGPEPSKPEPVRAGTEHILLVEDDAHVRTMLRRQLERQGYRVSEAANGDGALDSLQSDPTIALVVTDIVMPGQYQGPDLARVARGLRSDLPVVFLSGYPRESALVDNALGPDDVTLLKPVRSAELLQAVRAALDSAQSTA
jgi:PAS domain S-box-containing protein